MTAATAPDWRVVVAAGCEIGERPVWDARSGSVVWVDMTAGAVHRSLPRLDGAWTDSSYPVGLDLGMVALRRDGGLVAATDSAFVFLDAIGRPDATPVSVDLPDGSRFNDGGCDPMGRLLAGTTSAPDAPGNGVLLSLDQHGNVRVLLEGIVESNGLDWSKDGRTLYYVDSGEPVIRRYAYDAESGTVGERLTDLAVTGSMPVTPDGLVVDADGAVWVAMWEGGSIRCYAPDGSLVSDLPVPVTRPTCPAFIGPGLDILVVTTAWEGLSSDEREHEPWAGHLLATAAPVRGRLPHRFAEGTL